MDSSLLRNWGSTFPGYVRDGVMLGPAAVVFLPGLTHCGSLASRFLLAAGTDKSLAGSRLTSIGLIQVFLGVAVFTFTSVYSARGGSFLAIWGLAAALMGATVMGWNSIIMMAVQQSVPANLASKASSVSLFSAYAGTFRGPYVFQTLGRQTALSGIMPTVAIVLLGAGVLITFANRSTLGTFRAAKNQLVGT